MQFSVLPGCSNRILVKRKLQNYQIPQEDFIDTDLIQSRYISQSILERCIVLCSALAIALRMQGKIIMERCTVRENR